MDVSFRAEGDEIELAHRVRTGKDARQRDRYRCVLLVCRGEQTLSIACTIGRSRKFVQEWVYRYRDGGLEALRPGRSSGQPTKLPREREAAFKARMLGGPTERDGGVGTLRGLDAVRILEQEFGVAYSLDGVGVYDLLERLNLSCLKPRPRHRKNDPQAMKDWLERALFCPPGEAGSSRQNRRGLVL